MNIPAVAPSTGWNTEPVLDPSVGLSDMVHAASTQPARSDAQETFKSSETGYAPDAGGIHEAPPEPFAARLVGGLMDTQVAVQERRLYATGLYERWIDTSYGRIHLYDRPRAPGVQGPTWVFGHGFASHAVSWQAVLQHLAPYCARIILIDFPGHGASPEVSSDQPAIATTTASCLEAMDFLTGEDGAAVVPVGVSMGGLAATVYATERPQQTAGAALISPAGAPMLDASLDSLLVNFTPETYADARRTVDLFMPSAPFKPVMALGMLHLLRNPYNRRLLNDFRTYDCFSAERLGQLPSNTLLLWGEDDTVIPLECREHFFAHTPSAERYHVPDWSHFVTMHRAEALAQRLIEWGGRHNLLARQGPANTSQNS